MLAGLEDMFPVLQNRDPSTIQIAVAYPIIANTHLAPNGEWDSQWFPVGDIVWDDMVVKGKPKHFAIKVGITPMEQCRREVFLLFFDVFAVRVRFHLFRFLANVADTISLAYET